MNIFTIGKQFLALSAGVDYELLERKNQQGHQGQQDRYLFARGRQKYYGLGALVIFFAVFSGYGMGHMLSTMANMPTYGAVIAACLWAVFQWCLERQMLLSITHDASWIAKIFGFTWRSLLGFLSAITLVYPFFVESNRAEIEVKIADIARSRLVDNVASSKIAVGLPAMTIDLSQLQTERDNIEKELRSNPPELAALSLKARQCWARYGAQEKKQQFISSNKEKLSSEFANELANEFANALASIRTRCQAADTQVANTLLQWKRKKTVEKQVILNRFEKQQTVTDIAKERGRTLESDYAQKVAVASRSGFAADFTAVADLLKNDINRRIQFIWWLTWFFIIELVAIIVKFMSKTDVDYQINMDEKLTQATIEHQLSMQLHELAIAKLVMPTQVLQTTMQQMQMMEQQHAFIKTEKNASRIDVAFEQAIQQLLSMFSQVLLGKSTSNKSENVSEGA